MAQSILIPLKTVFDDKGLRQAQREISALGASIGRSLDMAVGGALAGATAGLVGAVKASSDYLAQMTGVEQVFGSAAKSVADFSKTAAKSAGLSATEALTAAKTFGLFANSAGLAGQSSANFATSLTQLAGDLGSFNEIPTAQVLADIQSGLQGQAEPLRKYGIFLTDAKLKEEAKNLAIYKGTGTLSDQQKMLASYSLILKSTQVQQGDFAKYSDDLGNSTKTLTATFADLQVEIGNAVRPALAEIIPVLQEMIPLLGEQLKAAVDSVDWKEFFKAIVGGIGFLIEHMQEIATFVATMWAMSKAIEAIRIAMSLATVATALFTGALVINPVVAMGTALAGLVAWIFMAKDAYDQAGTAAGKFAKAQADKKYAQSLLAKNGFGQTIKDIYGTKGTDNDARRTAAMLAEQAAARAASAAVSTGIVIPDILSGSTGTKASKARQTAIAKALAESVAEAKKQLALANDALKAEYEKSVALFDAQTEAIANFKTDLGDVRGATQPLTREAEAIGRFAQSVVDSFDSIDKSILDNKKTFSDEGASLRAYVATEKGLLLDLAKQRDALAEKYSLAQAVKTDIEGAIRSFGNITNLLDKQSTQVTETMTSVVNGIQLTRSKLVEQTTTGNIVSNFQAILDKTKAFATSLKKLRALGLDQNLYKQIVDAGVDAGGQTAEAILAGGSDTVASLNTIFQDLNSVGADIGEQTAQVMYGAGVDLTNGLLEGIKSKDQELMDQAKSMATLFADTFNSMVAKLIIPATAPASAGLAMQYPGFSDYINGALAGYSGEALTNQIDMLTGANVSAPGSFMNSLGYMKSNGVTVNINANTITDQASLPALVTNALMTANKQGLTNGLSRVLAI